MEIFKKRKKLVFISMHGTLQPESMEPEPSDLGCSLSLVGTMATYKQGRQAVSVCFKNISET